MKSLSCTEIHVVCCRGQFCDQIIPVMQISSPGGGWWLCWGLRWAHLLPLLLIRFTKSPGPIWSLAWGSCCCGLGGGTSRAPDAGHGEASYQKQHGNRGQGESAWSKVGEAMHLCVGPNPLAPEGNLCLLEAPAESGLAGLEVPPPVWLCLPDHHFPVCDPSWGFFFFFFFCSTGD